MIKQCAVCGKMISGHGLRKYCDPCKREKERERWREEGKKRRAANPEKVRENDRRWKSANPEKVREVNRRWREANQERPGDRWRIWREENPEKVRENRNLQTNQRSKGYGDALFFQMMESMTAISEAVETTKTTTEPK